MRLYILQLFPCHGNKGRFNTESGHRWVADAWYEDGTKAPDLFELDTLNQARQIVEAHCGEVRESKYCTTAGKYIGHDDDANLVVTHSHTICKSCRALRDFLPESV